MQIDLTQGSITKTMLRFAVPMICGNLLQQLYNIVDTLIVGQYLGADALAAVGSAYTLMTFLTSIFLGLCMGSGAIFAIRYGEKNMDRLKEDMFVSFVMTAGLTLFINIFIFWKLDLILHFLSVPEDVYALMCTACSRKFYSTAVISWSRGCYQYCSGSGIYPCMPLGCGRGSVGYRDRTMDIGSQYSHLYQGAMPMVESGTQAYAYAQREYQ